MKYVYFLTILLFISATDNLFFVQISDPSGDYESICKKYEKESSYLNRLINREYQGFYKCSGKFDFENHDNPLVMKSVKKLVINSYVFLHKWDSKFDNKPYVSFPDGMVSPFEYTIEERAVINEHENGFLNKAYQDMIEDISLKSKLRLNTPYLRDLILYLDFENDINGQAVANFKHVFGFDSDEIVCPRDLSYPLIDHFAKLLVARNDYKIASDCLTSMGTFNGSDYSSYLGMIKGDAKIDKKRRKHHKLK
jgi:hypothetical protein